MHALTIFFEWILAASARASGLALVVLIVQSLLRYRVPARWRCALWLPVLMVLLAPVFPESAWSFESLFHSVLASLPVADVSMTQAPLPSQPLWGVVWLIGVAGILLTGTVAYMRMLWRFKRSSTPVPDALLQAIAALAREIGLRRPPRVTMARAIRSPAVAGLLRPTLLLPANMEEMLTPHEVRLVLIHELTHIKRGDLPLNALLCVLLALHWFNPLLWLAFFKARLDCEAACDAQVLEREEPLQRVVYGHTLLKLETAFSHRSLNLGFIGIFQRGSALRARIQSITTHPNQHPLMKTTLSFSIALLTFLGITKAASFAGPLDGVWVNTKSSDPDIPKVEIVGTQLVWWGATTPQESKYGPMPLTLSGDSVEDKSPDKYGYATEDAGFADNVFFIKRDGERLVLDCLTVFKDGSGRANYRVTYTFTRKT